MVRSKSRTASELALGWFRLDSIISVRVRSERQNEFQITTSDGSWCLRAEKRDDRNDWLLACGPAARW